MPIVQTYGGRKVGTAALPGVRKRAAETNLSTGVGVDEANAQRADTIGRMGEQVTRVGQIVGTAARAIKDDAQRKADEVARLEYNNALEQYTVQALYDPTTGALQRKGKDAQGLPEEVSAGFDRFTGDLDATLNARQRAEWGNKDKANHWQNLQGPIVRHTFAEQQAHDQQEFNSFLTNQANAAAANAPDQRRVEIAVQDGTDAIALFARRQGLGDDAQKEITDAFTTKTHIGVIQKLLSAEQPKQAEAYYAAKKSQINGLQQDELETAIQKALKVKTVRGDAQIATAKILARGGTLTEQREQAKAIENPEVQDEVLARLEHEDTVKTHATNEAEKATLRTAYDTVDQTHDVTKIPANVWKDLDGSTRNALRSYADGLAKQIPIKTDLPTYYGLMQQAADDPQAFANVNLLKHRGKLDDVEFKQLAGLQLSIKNGDRTKADKDLAGFRTHSQIVTDTLWQATHTEEKDYTSAQRDAKVSLLRLVDQRVAAAQDQGKKVTNEEVQGMVDDLLSQRTTTPGSTWFGMFFQSQGWHGPSTKKLLDTTIGDISAEDRAHLERALRDRGQPVSDATILDLYLNVQTRKAR